MHDIVWVIHDRKKFSALVMEIKDLVDSLQSITNPAVLVARQAETMRRKISDICDPETLSLIAEVCSENHLDIADAASTQAEKVFLASTHRRHVAAWTESVEEVKLEAQDIMLPDLESLTVTELKHKLLEMHQERKNRKSLEIPPLSRPKPDAVSATVEPLLLVPSSTVKRSSHRPFSMSQPRRNAIIPSLKPSRSVPSFITESFPHRPFPLSRPRRDIVSPTITPHN